MSFCGACGGYAQGCPFPNQGRCIPAEDPHLAELVARMEAAAHVGGYGQPLQVESAGAAVEWRAVPLDVERIGRPLLVAFWYEPANGQKPNPRVTRVADGMSVKAQPNAYAIADVPSPPPIPRERVQ